MTERTLGSAVLHKTWPGFSLREKRVRLLEEKIRTAVIEARLLGIGRGELAEMLRLFDEEAP